MKNVRPGTVDLQSLKLSPEEGFVLSRVEDGTTVRDLVALTGFDENRIVEILVRLSQAGAVEVDGAHGPFLPSEAPRRAPPAPRLGNAGEGGLHSELLAYLDGPSEAPIDDEGANAASTSTGDHGEVEASPVATEPPDDSEKPGGAQNEREYRKIYETVYHPMSRDERINAAHEVSGTHLLALCFDPDPLVVDAVLTNPRTTLDAPRLLAMHHRTHAGLEHVAKRSAYLADALVQRRLLRNPQLPSSILQRILGSKPTLEVYKVAIDREIPERSRVMTRELLRKKFMLASADERASLLFKTEGRALVLLVGCNLDANTTQMLCSKGSYSILFIQNLTRWSATPPALLAHLIKLPVVRRNVSLRKMILRHPNTPSDVKRHYS